MAFFFYAQQITFPPLSSPRCLPVPGCPNWRRVLLQAERGDQDESARIFFFWNVRIPINYFLSKQQVEVKTYLHVIHLKRTVKGTVSGSIHLICWFSVLSYKSVFEKCRIALKYHTIWIVMTFLYSWRSLVYPSQPAPYSQLYVLLTVSKKIQESKSLPYRCTAKRRHCALLLLSGCTNRSGCLIRIMGNPAMNVAGGNISYW